MNISKTDNNSPFHSGEQAIQGRTGKRDAIEKFGKKAIRSFMPDQHREFYQQLPFLVVGSVDKEGFPWASILTGKPGFIQSPSPTTLQLMAKVPAADPVAEALSILGNPLGLLGIELATRRRNRVNVRVNQIGDRVGLSVDQSFGNCPQYIQARELSYVRDPDLAEPESVKNFTELDQQARLLIQTADTLFVSSFVKANDQPEIEGVDVSHKAGMPGFVRLNGNTLTVPDFSGNYYFNTLGNFLLNPQAGIVFPDFETGDLLMLTGRVEILWEDNPDVIAFKGAQRAWRFTIEKGKWLKGALPFRASIDNYSPNSLITGTWEATAAVIESEKLRDSWQPLKVVNIEQESSLIKSFYFKHAQGKALLPFEAGQYLTIKVSSTELSATLEPAEKIIRTYTVSSAPHEDYYRISVKKEPKGQMSNYLHEQLKVGDIIDIKAPSGDFYIDPLEKRPAVLLAGGVGITPMISIAQHVANEDLRSRFIRPLTIFHATRSTRQRAFTRQFRQLENSTSGAIRYYSFISQASEGEKSAADYNGLGRLSADVLRQALALDDYDFYICGPASFMQTMYDSLRSLGVADQRIFAEAFGVASLKRIADKATISELLDEASDTIVRFTESVFEQRWKKGDPTLLEVAESQGLSPEYGCRNGACGSCAVSIKAGEIVYRNKPAALLPSGKALICCAVPAKGTQVLQVKL